MIRRLRPVGVLLGAALGVLYNMPTTVMTVLLLGLVAAAILITARPRLLS